MSGKTQSKEESSENNSEKGLDELIETLAQGSRRERQQAAAEIAAIAKEDAQQLAGSIAPLVDALNRPEAQTRWEILDALTEIVVVDARPCEKALPGAETALFDEDSGPVRLAAMRFLCRYGSTTENRSEKTWPLIDEAIQCYHGDLEFQDMLVAVVEFSGGKLSKSVKEALKERMSFDAVNGRGSLKKRAAQIIENVS